MTSHQLVTTTRRAVTLVAGLLLLGACADDAATTAPATPALGRGAATTMSAMPGMANESASGLEEGALYVADLHPLNPRVQRQLDPTYTPARGLTQGTAYFRVVNGMLTVVENVRGATPANGHGAEGLHPQHIHASTSCPPEAADVNHDGIVDVIEGLPYYGPIFVPLDQDLANLGFELSFPFGNAQGRFTYQASAPVAAIQQSLTQAFMGQPANQVLNLGVRHVVVHGVSLATPLPATVQTINAPDGSPIPPQLTLPVACGSIRQVR